VEFGRQIKFAFVQLISKLYKINMAEKTEHIRINSICIENNEICMYLYKLYSDTWPAPRRGAAPPNKRTLPWRPARPRAFRVLW